MTKDKKLNLQLLTISLYDGLDWTIQSNQQEKVTHLFLRGNVVIAMFKDPSYRWLSSFDRLGSSVQTPCVKLYVLRFFKHNIFGSFFVTLSFSLTWTLCFSLYLITEYRNTLCASSCPLVIGHFFFKFTSTWTESQFLLSMMNIYIYVYMYNHLLLTLYQV